MYVLAIQVIRQNPPRMDTKHDVSVIDYLPKHFTFVQSRSYQCHLLLIFMHHAQTQSMY